MSKKQKPKQLTEMQLKQKLLKSSDYDEQFAAMHEKLRQVGARFVDGSQMFY